MNSFKDKHIIIFGITDTRSIGWSIAIKFASQGAYVHLAIWTPVYNIFCKQLELGKFDDHRLLDNGKFLNFSSIEPVDVRFCTNDDIPLSVRSDRKYVNHHNYSLECLANKYTQKKIKFTSIIHSVAFAKNINKPLLETSRDEYLSCLNSTTYSLTAISKQFLKLTEKNAHILTLTFDYGNNYLEDYSGGGIPSAKRALENDVKQLAWELGGKNAIRVNAISAGTVKTRASSKLDSFNRLKSFCDNTNPLGIELSSTDIANTAFFLSSDNARAITASVIYVDAGMHSLSPITPK
jgi:enoyl-[acyl-carrier protein] reductase I